MLQQKRALRSARAAALMKKSLRVMESASPTLLFSCQGT